MLYELLKKILKLGYFLPHIILGLCALTYLYFLLSGRYTLMLQFLIILIPTVAVSLLLLKYRKKIWSDDFTFCDKNAADTAGAATDRSNTETAETKIPDSSPDTKKSIHPKKLFLSHPALIKLFGTIFCLAAVWMLLSRTFDAVFLILIILLYFLVLLQILFFDAKKDKAFIVLIEVLAAFALHVIGSVAAFAYCYGITDVCLHLNWVQTIIESGGLNTILGSYETYCLYHVETAVSSIFSGLPPYAALYISSIPLAVISGIFIYYIAKHFTRSEKTSLFAVFFYVMIPVVIMYAQYPMPRMYASIAFFIFLYFFFKNDGQKILYALILPCTVLVYMILVHHAQLIPIVLMMTGIVLFMFIYKQKFTLKQKIVTGIFYVFTLASFAVNPYSSWAMNLLSQLSPKFLGAAAAEMTAPAETLSVSPDGKNLLNSVEEISILDSSALFWINTAASVLMLCFILAGVYFLLSPKRVDYKAAFLGLLGLLIAVIFLPNFLECIQGLTELINLPFTDIVNRIRMVISPLFAVLMAVGAGVLCNIFKDKNQEDHNKTGVCLVLVLCILLIIASPILMESRNSSVFGGTPIEGDTYFTEGELAGFSIVNDFLPQNTKIYGDHPIKRYFPNNLGFAKYNMPYHTIGYGGGELFTEDVNKIPVQYIVLREMRYINHGLNLNQAYQKYLWVSDTENYTQQFRKNTYKNAVIYDDRDIVIYYNK